jgi:hypothetical protein
MSARIFNRMNDAGWNVDAVVPLYLVRTSLDGYVYFTIKDRNRLADVVRVVGHI